MTKISGDVMQLRDKPLEEMALEELYSERACHAWHKNKIHYFRQLLKKKKWWLEQNRPILSKEEIKGQYERGELTKKQYQTAFASRKKAIDYRMRVEDYMDYAEKVIFEQGAIVTYIDELIQKKLSSEVQYKETTKDYDPRKPISPKNPPPPQLDPQQKWATRRNQHPLPKLRKARARWRGTLDKEAKSLTINRKLQPIVYWDVDKLRQIAKDKGYYTEVALMAAIADTLNLTIASTRGLIESGKLSWGQCIILGSLFQMTPKEFCDVFLSGYFKEMADGVYRAYVENTDAVLDKPYQAKAREVTEENVEDIRE